MEHTDDQCSIFYGHCRVVVPRAGVVRIVRSPCSKMNSQLALIRCKLDLVNQGGPQRVPPVAWTTTRTLCSSGASLEAPRTPARTTIDKQTPNRRALRARRRERRSAIEVSEGRHRSDNRLEQWFESCIYIVRLVHRIPFRSFPKDIVIVGAHQSERN